MVNVIKFLLVPFPLPPLAINVILEASQLIKLIITSHQTPNQRGCPGVPVHEGIPFVFITIHGVMTQFVNVSFFCVPVHEDTTKSNIKLRGRQWLLRNFYAFFSSVSLSWEVLPTVPWKAIVPLVSPVVQIESVERVVTTVRPTASVGRASNAVITNASAFTPLVPVRPPSVVTLVSSAVVAHASVVRLLVPARTTPIVTLERIVVGEFVRHHIVVGAAELLQALLSAQLFSSQSSFPLCPVSAVLVARTTAIVHPVL